MAAVGEWYYVKDGQTAGPTSLDELRSVVATLGASTLVWGPGVPEWTEARHVSALSGALGGPTLRSGPPVAPTGVRADEIDYQIAGDDMQYVEIVLDPGEMVIAEAGAMMYMSQGIEMETVFGDPAKNQGFFGKLLDAGKRVITGESLFLTTFSAASDRREQVAFAAPYPGKIIPMRLDQLGGELIAQKDAFLCAARGVHVGIAFQKKILTGLFGGEGFILERLTGDGIAFVHAGGTICKRELAAGETLRLDTGCLVALQPSVDYDVEVARGIKNTIFGGEGMFLATLRGPGAVWMQSLPFSRLAGRVLANLPSSSHTKGEGSILGGLFNVFEAKE